MSTFISGAVAALGRSLTAWTVSAALCLCIVALPERAGRATSLAATAPVVTFSGSVHSALDDRPITGATVKIGATSATTDANGQYSVAVGAATAFQATAAAPGYLAASIRISAQGQLISGPQRLDFTGALGLKALNRLTVVVSGVVRDARTAQAIVDAVVATPGHRASTDGTGHYAITAPSSPRLQLEASALGYQWPTPALLWHGDRSPLLGQVTLDFDGQLGLRNAFSSADGDTLLPFSQVVGLGTKELLFSGQARQDLEPAFAVTYPNGRAALFPLTITGRHFAGRLPLDQGAGLYHLEINARSGFAILAMPLYVGTAYRPPPPRPVYPADATGATTASLEAQALDAINAARQNDHLTPLTLDSHVAGAARAHSADVVRHDYYYQHPHLGSNGSAPADRLSAAGAPFHNLAEDVGLWSSAQGAVASFLASPAHRVHVLSPLFDSAGVGIARRPDGDMVVTVDYLRSTGQSAAGASSAADGPSPLTTTVTVSATLPATTSLTATTAGATMPRLFAVDVALPAAGGHGPPAQPTESLALFVPAGAMTTALSLRISVPPLSGVPLPVQGQPPQADVALGFAFDLTAVISGTDLAVRRFDQGRPLTLQVHYDPAAAGDLDPTTLRLAYYDPTTRAWRDLATTADVYQHTLTAAITHFTLFQVRATARTRAQVTAAQARLARLAAAGAPLVTVQPPSQSVVGGVPLLISIPAGAQLAPLSVSVTGLPGARVQATFVLPGGTTVQTFSLDARGYGTTAYLPGEPLRTAQPLQVAITVAGGATAATVRQRVTLLPARGGAPPPGLLPLRLGLASSTLRVGGVGPVLTVTTAPGAAVRAVLSTGGPHPTALATAAGAAGRGGAVTLRFAMRPRSALAGAPLRLVVTATLRGRSTTQTLSPRIAR